MITVHNRYGQTDRQMISNLNTALCTKVHRAVKRKGREEGKGREGKGKEGKGMDGRGKGCRGRKRSGSGVREEEGRKGGKNFPPRAQFPCCASKKIIPRAPMLPRSPSDHVMLDHSVSASYR